MITLKALLCVLTFFSIAARRSPSVYVANLTLIPGYCFSKLDLVSGIIWPVISGLDTTATVTVPELLLLLVLPLEPPLEQAATAASAATQPTAPSVRSLNREDLINNLRNDEDVPASGTDQGPWRAGRNGTLPSLDLAGRRARLRQGPRSGGRPATFRTSWRASCATVTAPVRMLII